MELFNHQKRNKQKGKNNKPVSFIDPSAHVFSHITLLEGHKTDNSLSAGQNK